MKNPWQIVNLKQKENKFEGIDSNVDQKQLDAKIEQFSDELVNQFGDILKGIKNMKEIISPGTFIS